MILEGTGTPAQVSCGYYHTIVRMTNHSLYGTGYNYFGQLGIGTTENVSSLTVMTNTPGDSPTQVICGGYHTVILFDDGAMYATGRNNYGQLGIGTIEDEYVNSLTQMINETNALPTNISCGNTYTMVLMDNDTIYGTGNNWFNQLGTQLDESVSTLTPLINSTVNLIPSYIACGEEYTMIMMNDATIYGTGNNGFGQIGSFYYWFNELDGIQDKTPIQIALGVDYIMILMNDGSVYGTGNNSGSGKMGIGNEYDVFSLKSIPLTNTATQISCGYDNFTFILMEDGTIYGTGSNGYGQLGIDNDYENINTFTLCLVPENKTVTKIACGGYYTMILTSDGFVYATGANEYGQFGTNQTESSTIFTLAYTPPNNGIYPIDVCCGGSFSILHMNDGTILGTGNNDNGQLGIGNTTNVQIWTSIPLPDGKTPSQVSCGEYFLLILMDDETIYGTGFNYSGQLGIGNNDNVHVLTQMNIPQGETPIQISCGNNYSMVLMENGTVYGCGYNGYGELSIGTTNMEQNTLIQAKTSSDTTISNVAFLFNQFAPSNAPSNTDITNNTQLQSFMNSSSAIYGNVMNSIYVSGNLISAVLTKKVITVNSRNIQILKIN
jgi:alpha-tubulin suppressor-like RCC1 family protein